MTISTCATATGLSVGSCATHKRREEHLGSGRSLRKATEYRWRIGDMQLAAKMRLCDLRRNGYAMTSFALALPTYRYRMSRHLSSGVFIATPKFGSP